MDAENRALALLVAMSVLVVAAVAFGGWRLVLWLNATHRVGDAILWGVLGVLLIGALRCAWKCMRAI